MFWTLALGGGCGWPRRHIPRFCLRGKPPGMRWRQSPPQRNGLEVGQNYNGKPSFESFCCPFHRCPIDPCLGNRVVAAPAGQQRCGAPPHTAEVAGAPRPELWRGHWPGTTSLWMVRGGAGTGGDATQTFDKARTWMGNKKKRFEEKMEASLNGAIAWMLLPHCNGMCGTPTNPAHLLCLAPNGGRVQATGLAAPLLPLPLMDLPQ